MEFPSLMTETLWREITGLIGSKDTRTEGRRANLRAVRKEDEQKTTFTGLILLSGIDKPGVTQGLFSALSPFAITIQDLEQVVIRGRLILTALITLDPAHARAIEADISAFAQNVDLDFAIDYLDLALPQSSGRSTSLHVVLLSQTLLPSALARVAGEIAEAGAISSESGAQLLIL